MELVCYVVCIAKVWLVQVRVALYHYDDQCSNLIHSCNTLYINIYRKKGGGDGLLGLFA